MAVSAKHDGSGTVGYWAISAASPFLHTSPSRNTSKICLLILHAIAGLNEGIGLEEDRHRLPTHIVAR